MNAINPANYVGANLTLVGYAATEARNPAYDKDGTRGVKQIPIAINEGYTKDGEFFQTGTTWYEIEAAGDAAQELTRINKGDKLRVDNAKQEVREYTDREGNKKLGITLRYGQITVLESKGSPASDDNDSPF